MAVALGREPSAEAQEGSSPLSSPDPARAGVWELEKERERERGKEGEGERARGRERGWAGRGGRQAYPHLIQLTGAIWQLLAR